MKNIHILPTVNPSRLTIQLDCKPKYNLQLSKVADLWTKNWENQHIYLTSDEKIKKGEWCYCFRGDVHRIEKAIHDDLITWKKIILTTDKDLIKDGVQAIDDEFLEWFVNNPTCEFIEVKHQHIDEIGVGDEWSCHPKDNNDYYKIIIPKEELKQDCECIDECLDYITKNCKNIEENENYLDSFDVTKLEMDTFRSINKQETLEEAAKRLYPIQHVLSEIKQKGFIEGANWQEQRMYSEKDVLRFAQKYSVNTLNKSHLEQFKNK